MVTLQTRDKNGPGTVTDVAGINIPEVEIWLRYWGLKGHRLDI